MCSDEPAATPGSAAAPPAPPVGTGPGATGRPPAVGNSGGLANEYPQLWRKAFALYRVGTKKPPRGGLLGVRVTAAFLAAA